MAVFAKSLYIFVKAGQIFFSFFPTYNLLHPGHINPYSTEHKYLLLWSGFLFMSSSLIELCILNATFKFMYGNNLLMKFVLLPKYVKFTCFCFTIYLFSSTLFMCFQVQSVRWVWVIMSNVCVYLDLFVFFVSYSEYYFILLRICLTDEYFCSDEWQEIAGMTVSVVLGFCLCWTAMS
jgi:hypothetical protein